MARHSECVIINMTEILIEKMFGCSFLTVPRVALLTRVGHCIRATPSTRELKPSPKSNRSIAYPQIINEREIYEQFNNETDLELKDKVI